MRRKRVPVHAQPHRGTHTCCVCKTRYPIGLVEVYASGNWHPICRPCLKDIGLGVFGTFDPDPRAIACDGQEVMAW